MDDRKGRSDHLDTLIERLEDARRQAERVRSYANEGLSRRPFWPERRREPRMTEPGRPSKDSHDEA